MLTCGLVVSQVKIAVIVEHLANHRTEMVYKLVSPPFHDMPVIAEGVSYYESDSDGAAVADGTPGIDKKRKVESSQKPRKQKKNKAA